MCVWIRMYVCMYVCVYLYVCMYVCMHACMRVCTHTHSLSHTHTCVCVCVCVCTARVEDLLLLVWEGKIVREVESIAQARENCQVFTIYGFRV